MLTKIDIPAGQYVRYKSSEPVPAGLYYWTKARLTANERLKKSIAAVPVSKKDGTGFMWLIPYERWVKRVLEGYEPPEQVYTKDAAVFSDLAATLGISHVWHKLRGWQKHLCAQLVHGLKSQGYYRRGWRAPMGAGKTLAGLCALNNFERPLVVAPPYLHGQWADEAKAWGLTVPRFTSYQSAHKIGDADAVVLDEVLIAKNPATKNHRQCAEAGIKADVVLGFTATPSSVHPMDLRWLRAVSPGCVPQEETAWRFMWGLDTDLVEVAPGRQAYVTKTWDLDAVSRFTAPYLGVVDLDEIRDQLPGVIRKRVYVDTPPRYKMVLKGAGTENGKPKAIAQARQMSDGFIYGDDKQPIDVDTKKIDAIEAIVRGTEEPVVVFAAWDHTVERLCRRFEDLRPAKLSGSCGDYSVELRRYRGSETCVDGANTTQLLVCNASISLGMNLQRGRIVIFCSNSMNPVYRQQAVGRLVRPGQKAAGVVVYDIMAKDTLDERMLELLEKHTTESEAFIAAALGKGLSNE